MVCLRGKNGRIETGLEEKRTDFSFGGEAKVKFERAEPGLKRERERERPPRGKCDPKCVKMQRSWEGANPVCRDEHTPSGMNTLRIS